MLHPRRAQAAGDLLEYRIARFTFRVDADLDELVGAERAVDLGENRIAEAGGADRDDRVEGMGARLERTSIGGADLWHGAMMAGRVRGGKRWIDEHIADQFVQRARAEGYRSRAAYKLIEIDERDRLLVRARVIVDLGAAPGSWTEVAAKRAAKDATIVALDLLPIAPLAGVTVIQGDFSDTAVLENLVAALAGRAVDLVLSDLAPNLSGIAVTDQARGMALAELALEFARTQLKPGGTLLVKAFQGAGFGEFLALMRRSFERVGSRKPDASRDRSREIYLLGTGFRRSGAP